MAQAYFERFVIELTRDEAHTGYHVGKCNDDIAWLRTQRHIDEQLCALSEEDVRSELEEYGAWDDDELADHDANLSRVLWLACGDIYDQKDTA
jgi:hypothetical protein